jgi:hypothetical protein
MRLVVTVGLQRIFIQNLVVVARSTLQQFFGGGESLRQIAGDLHAHEPFVAQPIAQSLDLALLLFGVRLAFPGSDERFDASQYGENPPR